MLFNAQSTAKVISGPTIGRLERADEAVVVKVPGELEDNLFNDFGKG